MDHRYQVPVGQAQHLPCYFCFFLCLRYRNWLRINFSGPRLKSPLGSCPALSGGPGYLRQRIPFESNINCRYSTQSSLPCLRTYFATTSSFEVRPTVGTKYPSVHSSPPHNFSFTSGCSANIRRAVTLFTVLMISLGEWLGVDWIRK